ncbi:MAG: glycosyltransferase family 4 protein [Candidatus Fermentibacteraceae bacterium]
MARNSRSYPGAPLRGVNYAGFLRAGLGLGHAARGYIRSLEGMGIDVLRIDADELLPGRTDKDKGYLSSNVKHSSTLHPVNIVHINPDLLNTFRNQVGSGFFRNRFTIGIWAWETESFPGKWHDRFSLMDEIWVGGSFMARGISTASPVPVILMPHVVQPEIVKVDREKFGLNEDEYIFLFSFDFNSSLSRKNPLALIKAFRMAFKPTQKVRLVIKSQNSVYSPHQMNTLREAAEGLNVCFIDQCFDDNTNLTLTKSCDAYVSLHRAEGFGLGIAEAMAMGKPVIATGWSGNMDFMNTANSIPVRYELAPLAETDPPYEKGSLWAVPDLADAAQKMRLLFENRSLGHEIGHLAKEYMLRHNSPEAVGQLIGERLAMIDPDTSHGKKTLPPETLRRLRVAQATSIRWFCSVTLKRLPERFTGIRTVLERAKNRASEIL